MSKSTEQRFWAKVQTFKDDCWKWLGAKDWHGYGQFRFNGKLEYAHRASWAIHFGSIPELRVLHKCDNPECVNPDHLFLGTQQDNVNDMISKKRAGFQSVTFLQRRRAKSKLAPMVGQIMHWKSEGVSQCEIARRLGVQQSSISRIVNNINLKPIPCS